MEKLQWAVYVRIGDRPEHKIGTASGGDPHQVMDGVIGLLRVTADELEAAQQEAP
jgi:hypothetical protein